MVLEVADSLVGRYSAIGTGESNIDNIAAQEGDQRSNRIIGGIFGGGQRVGQGYGQDAIRPIQRDINVVGAGGADRSGRLIDSGGPVRGQRNARGLVIATVKVDLKGQTVTGNT